MTERKTNQYAGACRRCGGQVPAGMGVLERSQGDDGAFGWHVAHDGPCPQGESSGDVPLWAVYCEGLTPMGNPTFGTRLVRGPRPDGDCEPMNPAAEAIERRDPRPLGEEEHREWLEKRFSVTVPRRQP